MSEQARPSRYTPIPPPRLGCPSCNNRVYAPERGARGWAFGVPVTDDAAPVTCPTCAHVTTSPTVLFEGAR